MTRLPAALRRAVVDSALAAAGHASGDARRGAFDNRPSGMPTDALVDRVARHAWTVRDQDVAAPLAAGVSEDVVFELAVCAALGQATRQIEAALAALDAAAPADRETLP